MLRSIIISPNQELARQLQSAISGVPEITVSRTLDRYPPHVELGRAIRAQAPEIIFLSFEEADKAAELVKFIEGDSAGVQIVAIHPVCDAQVMRETMRAGVREFLAPPFERNALFDTLRTVKELLERRPTQYNVTSQIFTFLPSKAGVGASTLALNISAAMARRPDNKILLADFDMNSGMLRFMLKLNNEYSVLDALEHAQHADEELWPQLVTPLGNLEVLHAGRINPNLRIEPGQIRNLVNFMRRNYQGLCFDLSGNLERYSLELMQESKRILLVCTPEVASLHLAREKIAFLRQLELDSRISIILNRCTKKPLFNTDQVESLLGMKVLRSFGNDYQAVTRSVTAGKCLDPTSELGKQYSDFALELLDKKQAPAGNVKRKFLEYFSPGEAAAVSTK